MDTPRDTNDLTQGIATESEGEIQCRLLFELSPFGVLLLDDHGHIVKFNKAAYSDLGYTREEFQKLTLADIDPIESPEEIQKRIEKTIKDGKAEFYVKHKTKYGENRDVHVITQPTVISGRYYFHTIWIDVTEKMRLERLQRESEQKFRTLFESANDGILILSLEGKIIDANTIAHERLGYTKEELIGLNITDIDPPEYAKLAPERLQEVRFQGRGVFEVAHKRKDGSFMPVETNLSLTEIGGEQVLLGIVRDITERKRIEDKLRQNEADLSEAQRIAKIGSWEWYIETNEAHWSDETYRLFGLARSKLDRHRESFLHFILPEDRQRVDQALSDAINGTRKYDLDYRIKLTDGTEKDIHAQAEVIRNNMGQPLLMRGTVQDITERKQTEEKIQKSEKYIRNILDTVDEGFIVVDRDYRIMTANKAYCSQIGLPCDEVVGKHCYEASHRSGRPCFDAGEECAVRQVFATGDPHTAVHKHVDNDGQILFVETKAFPNKDKAGNVVSAIEVIHNITERHLLEAEQLKTQKLEAIGTLAGGIAHDFNNLLQGVFGYVSMAKMVSNRPEQVVEMLDQAEKALSLSVNLTTQLLTFAKGGKPVRKCVDLKPVIENAANFALSGSQCNCRLKSAPDLWPAEVDKGQISQVIQNIVLNASEAMPAGGTVELSARNTVPKGSGRQIRVEIKDSGIGIPESCLSKIFDPYFTTKQKGSGLGLATSYSIVKNHGGSLEVASTLGKGTTFLLRLPACEREAEQEESLLAPADELQGKKRVLVMDDEAMIRDVAKSMIKSLGHDVELACHGEEAIGKYQGAFLSGDPFDLVILDLTIKGGMGGLETIKNLMEIDPNVKAVVSSGYSDDPVVSNCQDYGFKGLLNKPYAIEGLKKCLNGTV